MDKRIVINTGPLIALMRIQALEIVEQLDLEFLAPEQVRHELEQGTQAGHPLVRTDWLSFHRLEAPLTPMVLSVLDIGEAAVIQLAMERSILRVAIDELKGRRMALAVGLKVNGVLGLLGKAKQQGIITEVKPYLDRAVQAGIRYHPDLIHRFLTGIGELP